MKKYSLVTITRHDYTKMNLLDSVFNLDALIIDNHLGKTALGGIVYGKGGLLAREGELALHTIKKAIGIMKIRPQLNVLHVPFHLDNANLKHLVLIPMGEQQWEGRWIKNPWGRHCWIDFIYAAVFSSLFLLDINHTDIRTIGIDLSWNLGKGYFEPACDALLNFSTDHLEKEISVVFYGHEGNNTDHIKDPLPARQFFQRRYQEDGFEGIEFNNWSRPRYSGIYT